VKLALLLVFACGCDLVFTLSPPDAADTSAIDAPDAPDARDPARCPAMGAPVFSQSAQVITAANCVQYTVSLGKGVAVAVCGGDLVEGPIDSATLSPMSIAPPTPGGTLGDPRLSPDGEQLFVTARDTAGRGTIELYRRSDGTWVHDPTATIGLPTVATFSEDLEASPPTSGAAGRMTIVATRVNEVATFTEFTDSGGGVWIDGRTYDADGFGILNIKQPSLTEDGLRLVFVGNSNIQYTVRDAIGDAFPAPSRIETVFEIVTNPYLTPQCERLYVMSLLSANYIEQ
jgi:hypothetical protein